MSETSFKIQTLGAGCAIGAFILLEASALWSAILILTVSAVLGAELFNTALEHLVDHIHPDLHPTIKIVKDCAAGAVLIFSLGSIGVFILFLSQKMLVLCQMVGATF